MNEELLTTLAADLGSPLYVYDRAEVRAAHRDLTSALPAGSELFYSLKANPHPAVVAELVAQGCGAEVSSVGELRTALLAGASPHRCLYTGPGKTGAEIDEAVASGIEMFSVDSPHDIQRIGAAAARTGRPLQVIIRVNPTLGAGGGGLAMSGEASPFGADAEWIARSPDDFTHPYVDVRGIHIFLATNLLTVDAILGAASASLDAVAALAPVFPGALDVLDLGGGFGHPFARPGARPDLSGLRAPLTDLIEAKVPAPPGGRRVAFESGRYLTGACGHLVTTVQDVKHSHGREFVVLDSGIHHLGGMYGLRRVPSLGLVPLTPGRDADAPRSVDVVGPLCTPLDAWARNVELAPVAPGDVVVVPNVGAYGLTASLVGFLGRDLPVEVVVDGDEVVDVSQVHLARSRVPGPYTTPRSEHARA